jgi:hypothetical protein
MSPPVVRTLGNALLAVHRRIGKRRADPEGAYGANDLAPGALLPHPSGTPDAARPQAPYP